MARKALHKSDEAVKRASYVVGHMQGIHKMLKSGEYCIDVINQVEAVEGSLKKLKQVILGNHLHNCVVESIKNGTPKQRAEAIEELLEVYKANAR